MEGQPQEVPQGPGPQKHQKGLSFEERFEASLPKAGSRRARGGQLLQLLEAEAAEEHLIADIQEDRVRTALREEQKRKEAREQSMGEQEPVDGSGSDGDNDKQEAEEEAGEEAGDDSNNGKKRPRLWRSPGSGIPGSGQSWIRLPGITSRVSVDRTKLSPKALQSLEKQDPPQEIMLLCLLQSESTKEHFPGLLSVTKADNVLLHMKSFHPTLYGVMEKAKKHNKDAQQAFAEYLENSRPVSNRGLKQLDLLKFGQRFNGNTVEPGAEKEVANVLRLVDSDLGFDSMNHSVKRVTNSILDLRLPGAEGTKARAALVSLAVRRLRHVELEAAKFFSTTADFATVMRKSIFVQTYCCISPDWNHVVDMSLDVVQFAGAHYSTSIAALMNARINAHTSDKCVHVYSISDSAADMRKATCLSMGHISFLDADDVTVGEVSKEFGGVLDAMPCFAHLEHLGMVAVLGVGGNPGSANVVSRDLILIHSMALHLKAHPEENDILLSVQQEEGKRSLSLMDIECVTRWNDRAFAARRFLELRPYVEKYYTHNACTFSIQAFPVLPKDGLMPAFWERLAGTVRVLDVFAHWSKALQTGRGGPLNAGLLPRCVFELRNACVSIEAGIGRAGDPLAVQELKTKLLEQVEHYMGPMLKAPTAPLKAAALDPNEADLSFYGVESEIIKKVWTAIAEDVKHFAPAHTRIAPALIEDFRVEMEQISRDVHNGAKQPLDVLAFWHKKAAQNPSESLIGAVFSETARALLTMQLSSASSERRIKGVKRILNRERNSLEVLTVEDLVVIQDWLNEGEFTKPKFKQLMEMIAKIVAEDKEQEAKYHNVTSKK
jgi:hypothetical protein